MVRCREFFSTRWKYIYNKYTNTHNLIITNITCIFFKFPRNKYPRSSTRGGVKEIPDKAKFTRQF